jgi:fatty-acyl-CoA synthase
VLKFIANNVINTSASAFAGITVTPELVDGDVATIDAHGYMAITDRAKDVIKSGGEWISSIEIENLAMGHPDVAEAAVIGVPHPRWDERPLLVAVKKPGAEVSREELLAFYEGKTAKWQVPDDVVFVDAIPLGATGKMLKTRLREQLKDYRLPSV